jgi:hypothetical protein
VAGRFLGSDHQAPVDQHGEGIEHGDGSGQRAAGRNK